MKHQNLVLIIAAFALSACHSNLYSTPRTVPKGKATHTVAVDYAVGALGPVMLYMARVGLSDRIDMGLQASYAFNRLDLKANIVRTKFFDMALDPFVEGGEDTSMGVWTWKAATPIMFGFNVDSRTTLMIQGGPVLMTYIEDTRYWETVPNTRTFLLSGAVGGGIQLRVTDLVAIQPEVSFNYFEYDAVYGTRYWACLGVGFSFGPQPQYDFSTK